MALATSAEDSVLAKECLTELTFLSVLVSEPVATPVQPSAATQVPRAGEAPQIPSAVVQVAFSTYLAALKPVVTIRDSLGVKSAAAGAEVIA